MKAKLLIYSLLLTGLLVADVQGQTNRKGTSGADYLLIPVTARTASLATGATGGLSNMAGVEALLANPAGLMSNTGTNVLFSRMEYVADIGVNYLGIGQRFGSNNIALTVQSWDFGDIPLTTEDAPIPTDNSPTWTATYLTAGLTYARQFTDRISAGVTAKVLSEKIEDTNASGVAFDAGMTYVVGESGLQFGVSLKNFGAQMSYGGSGLVRLEKLGNQQNNTTPNAVLIQGANYELPSLLNFGVTYTRPMGAASVTTLANFRSNAFAEDQYSLGLELGFQNLLYVRGGYQYQQDIETSFYTGANVGAGLNLNLNGSPLSIDYAYRVTRLFDGGVQMFTASFTL